MRSEIGSEFWDKSQNKTVINKQVTGERNTVDLLSGRTALDFIIRDIKKEHFFSRVLLPEYCCSSMIEPFIRNSVKVSFYEIKEDAEIYCDDPIIAYDAILILDFFGYKSSQIKKIAQKEKNKNKIVIYDATHMLDWHPELEKFTDYAFCSYRKWFYCNFARVKKNGGQFSIALPENFNKSYCEIRDRAANLKSIFMEKPNGEKKEFLDLFQRAENILEKNYVNFRGQPVEYDLKKIKSVRQRNAKYLIDALASVQEICLWKMAVWEEDIPLCVPILVKNRLRDQLRNYLVKNDIYCPIHWPINPLYMKKYPLKVYEEELSLVCDQRYDLNDMQREVEMIYKFFGEYKK